MNRIALLIPHFNNPQGLYTSLASIREAVDVIIVDDGSTQAQFEESTARALCRAQGHLHFLYLPHNQGIEYALNAGLRAMQTAQYEYGARLDCGDVVTDNRFRLQAAFLDAHPEVYLLGSAMAFFVPQADGQIQTRFTLHQPQTHAQIVRQMHDDNAFTHPSVMFRMAGLPRTGLYPLDCKNAEDFAWFWSFIQHYQTANLPQVLTFSEYNDGGISIRSRRRQQAMRIKILLRHFDGRLHSCLKLGKALLSYALPLSFARRIKRILGIQQWN